ncbi:MAG: PDZ domain-containing protein [Lachnospiraceae bacterium]|nr:PDZ domain-containing protein [Lachnospiraceae bacterium]
MEENRNQETDFMKETIKQRPLNRKKLIRRTLITVAMAVIFGMVACLTFLLLEPIISNKLYPEEKPSTVVFVEETEEEEILPEDMIVDESQMNPEPTQAPALEDEQIEQVLSEMQLGVEDYSSIYQGLSMVARDVQKSMVTVVGVTSDMDWFNNAYENEGVISGVIVADNRIELLILANINAIENAESLKITFADNRQYDAKIKKKDNNTGLAILSVEKTALNPNTLSEVAIIEMGSSASSSLVGAPIIAIGQPVGMADSFCYGFITSTGTSLNLPDSAYKLITTDIYGSKSATGILVNLKGKLIGIIDTENHTNSMENMISAIGITELKKTVQNLSNNKDIPYLGIHGSDVTVEVNQTHGVPFGVYMMEIDMDSPAMEAGIQSGDVLIRLDGAAIGSYKEFAEYLVDKQPGDTVTIGLLRQDPEGYAGMQVEVVLGMK